MAKRQPQPQRHQRTAHAARGVWLAAVVLVVAVLAAYSNSLDGEFIFDDALSVPDNPSIKSLWPIWPVLSPPRDGRPVEGRPVVNLTLAMNYAVHGAAVRGYHAVNLTIHVLATLTLMGVVRRTLLAPRFAQQFKDVATPLALAVALLWGLHPLQTESVSYISQRVESLMGLFYLLTLYCAIRAAEGEAERGSEGERGRGREIPASPPLSLSPSLDAIPRAALRWRLAAIIVCALGMGTKEVMVSAPLAVMLYDRVFLYSSWSEAWRARRGLYLGLAATWLALAAVVVPSLSRGGSAGYGQGMSALDYALTQFGVVAHYLRLCFWPHPLVFDYGTDLAKHPAEIVPYAVLIGALALGTLAAFRYWPWVGFLGFCFFATLAPSSSIVPVVTQTAAEHRMYLALAPVAILVVVGAFLAWRRSAAAPHLPLAALTLVAVALGARTYARNEDYRTQWAIWMSNLAHHPDNHRLHTSLAERYAERGDLQAALRSYGRAIELSPQIAATYDSRGTVWQKLQEWDEALADHTRAIELKPDAASYNNRALVYQRLGRNELALDDLEAGLRMAPDAVKLLYNRGSLWKDLNRHDKAIADFTRAVEVQPDFVPAWNDRGTSWQQLDRPEAAIQDYSRVIGLLPNNFMAYCNRGTLYGQLGRHELAVADLTQSIRLAPSDAASYYSRAGSLLALRRYDEAWSDIERFRQLGGVPDPGFLKQLTAASGRSGE